MNALLLGIRSFFPSPEGLPKRKVSEEQDRAGVGPQGAGGPVGLRGPHTRENSPAWVTRQAKLEFQPWTVSYHTCITSLYGLSFSKGLPLENSWVLLGTQETNIRGRA